MSGSSVVTYVDRKSKLSRHVEGTIERGEAVIMERLIESNRNVLVTLT